MLPGCIFEDTLLLLFASILLRITHETREDDLTAIQYKDGLSAVVV